MSRRPEPRPPRTRVVTPDGMRKLQAEFDRLWTQERPKVTREVSEAAAQGDRSENAEYIYGKKRLREIDRRMRFLQKRLDELTVVEPSRSQQEQGKAPGGDGHRKTTIPVPPDVSSGTHAVSGSPRRPPRTAEIRRAAAGSALARHGS